ncbi:MAG: discoidin domain-containing protein [Deltaproteobacteria bacterium]|nr:discoidin domain-containing protein [Deltaproteobacteria bacterium]
MSEKRGEKGRFRLRVPAVLLPLGVLFVGIAPHLGKLGDHVVRAHEYWYDAVGHMYLSWERFQTLTFQHGFFDFRWFYPYPSTGTYNEPSLTHGLLFGLFDLVAPGEAWAFNLAMVAILALNCAALYLLLRDIVRRPWIAAVFATVGALSPFAWIRYAHPPNTIVFWGLLGLLLLRMAARRPSWLRCAAVPALFTAQLYSSFYAGMFFVVPLVVLLPATLATARFHGSLRGLLLRVGAATLVCIPLLVALQVTYADTRSEMGAVNSYEYVSDWMKRGTGDLLDSAPLVCQLRALGVSRPQEECRGEMFPGRFVLVAAAISALLAAFLAVRRFGGGKGFRRGALRLGLAIVGGVLAFAFGLTLPFHLGLWAALAVPSSRRGGSLAVSSPLAAYVAAALLVVDVSVNPTVAILGFELGSIHRVFFEIVPGFEGLRSENRIAVLLPPLLAVVGAVGLRRILALRPLRRRPFAAPAILVPLALVAAVDAQPAWQEYEPFPRSDRPHPALEAAAALPDDAVLAVVKGRGAGITRRQHWDANYFLGHIVIHRHRQVTGYSTYNTPASEAIERATSLRRKGDRLVWASRVAQLFGATHLLVDWRDERSPSEQKLSTVLATVGGLELTARDDNMALVAIAARDDTARGPVAYAAVVSGKPIEPSSARGSEANWRLAAALDGDPETVWSSRRAQRSGQWIELTFAQPVAGSSVVFSPGRRTESLPTSYVVEVDRGQGFEVVYEQPRWEVSRALVDRPGTGEISIALPEEPFLKLRIRLTAGSPFAWNLATIAVHSDG